MPAKVGKKGGGKGLVAYFVDSAIPWDVQHGPYHIRTDYDCEGRPFGREITWYRFGEKKNIPGMITEITSFGWLHMGELNNSGIMHDVRTVEMLMDHCCPPELVNSVLGTEGIPG